MTLATASLFAAAGLATALLVDAPIRDEATWVRAAWSCQPTAAPTVSPEYLRYHALATSSPALIDEARPHQSCSPRKVVRT